MELTFKKAQKAQAKLRLGLAGPSGSGKTYTALAIGAHMGPNMGVIDTERGSASLYSDQFSFETLELPDFEPETYVNAIKAAAAAGINPLIIDSWSHSWERLKDRVDGIAKAKFRGNSWSAWSELTPIQNALVEAILQYPGHVIATMRTKTAWETEKDERSGRSKPVKVGLAPIQRDGVDYEFTLFFEMSEGGIARVGKTRWSEIADKVLEKPGQKFAKDLLGWLNAGAPAAPAKPFDPVVPAPLPSRPEKDGRAREQEKAILLDKIKAELVAAWPGQAASAIRAKGETLTEVFGTKSWREVETFEPEVLRVKFEHLVHVVARTLGRPGPAHLPVTPAPSAAPSPEDAPAHALQDMGEALETALAPNTAGASSATPAGGSPGSSTTDQETTKPAGGDSPEAPPSGVAPSSPAAGSSFSTADRAVELDPEPDDETVEIWNATADPDAGDALEPTDDEIPARVEAKAGVAKSEGGAVGLGASVTTPVSTPTAPLAALPVAQVLVDAKLSEAEFCARLGNDDEAVGLAKLVCRFKPDESLGAISGKTLTLADQKHGRDRVNREFDAVGGRWAKGSPAKRLPLPAGACRALVAKLDVLTAGSDRAAEPVKDASTGDAFEALSGPVMLGW